MLNLYIFLKELTNYSPKSKINASHNSLFLEVPCLCTKCPDAPQKNVLYIIEAKQLCYSNDNLSDFSFISIGEPTQEWFESDCDFLYLPQSVTAIDILNMICMLFHKYEKWEKNMQQIIDLHLPIVNFAEVSKDFIKNPVLVQGSAYHVLFTYLPETKYESDIYRKYRENRPYKPNDRMSSELINTLAFDSNYKQASFTTEATVFISNKFEYKTLYYNIYVNNIIVARLMFDEILEPFTDYDFVIIKIMGIYLSKFLSTEKIYEFDHSAMITSILKKLLQNELIDESELTAMQKESGWGKSDSIICIVIELGTDVNTNDTLETIALQLSKRLNNNYYIIFQNSIVMIYNMSYTKQSLDDLFYSILPDLRDRLCIASFSSVFHNIKHLYYYYQQTLIIKQIGQIKNPTSWYYRSDQYYFDYILYKCMRDSIPDILIPDGIQLLIEHDQKKGTSYCQLLKTYLECERNVAETIRKEYIHRNTFLYRMKKIEGIIKMDLDNPFNRLIILLAFYGAIENK